MIRCERPKSSKRRVMHFDVLLLHASTSSEQIQRGAHRDAGA